MTKTHSFLRAYLKIKAMDIIWDKNRHIKVKKMVKEMVEVKLDQ